MCVEGGRNFGRCGSLRLLPLGRGKSDDWKFFITRGMFLDTLSWFGRGTGQCSSFHCWFAERLGVGFQHRKTYRPVGRFESGRVKKWRLSCFYWGLALLFVLKCLFAVRKISSLVKGWSLYKMLLRLKQKIGLRLINKSLLHYVWIQDLLVFCWFHRSLLAVISLTEVLELFWGLWTVWQLLLKMVKSKSCLFNFEYLRMKCFCWWATHMAIYCTLLNILCLPMEVLWSDHFSYLMVLA